LISLIEWAALYAQNQVEIEQLLSFRLGILARYNRVMTTTIQNQAKIVMPTQGDMYQVMSDVVTYKALAIDTQGAYTVVEVIAPPQGGPPLMHVHTAQETFYVIEGTLTLRTAGPDGQPVMRDAPTGSVIHIPSMAPHTYRNLSDAPVRFLAVTSPSGMEDFWAELGMKITDPANPPRPAGPPDMARVMAICAKHGVTFVERPPQ
jgi:quercetin dioxygenase-like cupin family protein